MATSKAFGKASGGEGNGARVFSIGGAVGRLLEASEGLYSGVLRPI